MENIPLEYNECHKFDSEHVNNVHKEPVFSPVVGRRLTSGLGIKLNKFALLTYSLFINQGSKNMMNTMHEVTPSELCTNTFLITQSCALWNKYGFRW